LLSKTLDFNTNRFARQLLSVDLVVAGGSFELLDADVLAGLNFLQDFLLDAGTIAATLNWEDGSISNFTFGDELSIYQC